MTFFSEREVKSVRKRVQCCACLKHIEVGESATRWTGLDDGNEFMSIAYHPDCRVAEIALNRLHSTWDPDEWMGLDDLEADDHRWLLEEHPSVAARKGITLEAIEEDEREREECRRAWDEADRQRRERAAAARDSLPQETGKAPPPCKPVCKPAHDAISGMAEKVVGETGFEPATSCSQSRRATRLRHSPTRLPA